MGNIISTILCNAGIYDRVWIRFLKTWIFISLFVLILTAAFAAGSYHPDEHFQTIEFANYKLGNTDKSQLAWEFHERMRPWLQPFCYYVLIKIFMFFGITDPFTLVMIFRFFSAIFAWIMITIMMFSAYRLFDDAPRRKAVVYILALLSFLPYMFVRTSSESLSSSFIIAGFGLLMLGSTQSDTGGFANKRSYPGRLLFVVGILWGFAFEFRYQSAFLTAGFMLWLFFISICPKKKAAHSIVIVILGLLIPVILCTFLDGWGYGSFTFAPWNYLYQNIVLDRASGFGTSPFYGYISLMLSSARTLPFFAILLVGTLTGIVRNPKHPLSWGILMFFIAHSLIAHKEARFLMNILVPAIFLTVCGFYPAKNSGILNRVWNFRTSIPAGFFYAFNVLMLFIYAAAYDNTSVDIQFDKYLYRNLETPCTVYAINDSPYAPFGAGSIEYNFYKPAGLEVLYIESVDDNLAAMEGEGILVIADEKNDMLFSGNLSVKEIYHYEPRNIYSLLKAYVKKTKNFRWTLYRVTAK